MTLPLLETFTDPSRLKALAIAAGGDINSAAAECYLRVADGLGVLDEAALALATAMDAPEADPSLGPILRRIDAAEGAGELTDPAIVNPLRRINGEDPDGYVMARYHMRARELGADKAVMEAVGAVTITPAEERVGSIGKYRTKGTGPAWRRLARGIEGTPSDGLLLAIADAAGRADASFDEVMKELDGSAPLPDWFGDVLALALFEGEMRAWNAPVAEWRRESLMHVSTEALRAAVWNWVDDSSKHLRLVISDMGGGKTRAMVRKIGKRIREKEVDGRLRIDDQQAAIYVLVPTVVLGEEIIKLLEAEPLIRSYLIRGRSQPAPEPDEEGKACGMCRKKTMPTLASVSGLDTFSVLCKRGGVTCDHFDLCAWSRQSGDIIRGDCNVIVATHPFLAIRPLAGMPIPKPEMRFIDESPLKHVKRTERRRIAALGTRSAADLDLSLRWTATLFPVLESANVRHVLVAHFDKRLAGQGSHPASAADQNDIGVGMQPRLVERCIGIRGKFDHAARNAYRALNGARLRDVRRIPNVEEH